MGSGVINYCWVSYLEGGKVALVLGLPKKAVYPSTRIFVRGAGENLAHSPPLAKSLPPPGSNPAVDSLPFWHHGRVVSASDSQSGGPGFESCSGHLLDLFSVVPSSNSRPHL